MKKKTGLFFAILFIVIFSAFPVFAENFISTNGDYEYDICESLFEDGKTVAYISDYVASNSNARISIPSKIDGYDVEGIGHFAFQENEYIEEIYIDNGLKFIGYFSFSECQKLKEVHLPNSVETILDGAFMRCNQLTSFDIPSQIQTVGECIVSGNKIKTIKNRSNIDLDILIVSDPVDYEYSWFLDDSGSTNATIIPAMSTIYRKKTRYDYAIQYAEKYARALSDVNIPMASANDENSVIEYIKSKAPSGKPDSVSFSIESLEIFPAIAGTSQNKEGQYGYANVLIKIKNSLDENDVFELNHVAIIEPTPYTGSSSGDGSSSSGGSRNSTTTPANVISVTKESAKEGNWEKIGELWKLKLPNGSYASSQWALLNERWYLLGYDGIMKTDWQKVNEKWYFLSPDGSMLTGWQFVNNKWYWMDATGAMLESGTTPDGFLVNASGEWVQ